MDTIVCQSCCAWNQPRWITRCLESVRSWAEMRGFAYAFEGDTLLHEVEPVYREKAFGRTAMIADIARLDWAETLLGSNWRRVIWLDADVLVFAPHHLLVPRGTANRPIAAFSPETWVGRDSKGRLTCRRHINNAAMVFERGNPVLPFYRHACRRILDRVDAPTSPQLLGPKFLDHLDSVLGFDRFEGVDALSPLVIGALLEQAGSKSKSGPLGRFLSNRRNPVAAANLCGSLVGRTTDGVALDDKIMERVVNQLLAIGDVL